MNRLVTAALGVLLAGPASLAGQPASPAPVQTVRIDAIAEDSRGRLVVDLKAAEFEVHEDGGAKPVDSVQLRRGEGPRLVAIYLDEYHNDRDAVTDLLREQLTRFIDRILDPKDLLVVMKPLDSVLAIQLTTDREAARRAIATFEGRRGEYEPRNPYEKNFMAGTPGRIEAARTQVTVSALNALANQLGVAGTGRKALIVVSEGLPRSERRRGQQFLATLDTVAQSANRATVAVYAVDPRGTAAADDPGSQALRSLALDTGGECLTTNLDARFERIAAELSAYYLLTYEAPHVEDGGFHDVQVKVKRTGVRMRARKGFWAPSPEDALRAAILARANEPPKPARPPEPMPHASALIRPWVGLARGADGMTKVTVVWEPAARIPGDRRLHMPSRVVLTALAADGTALYDGPLLPTGAGVVDATGSAPPRAVFEAPPGRLRLRMAIEDVAADVLDRDVRDVTISDFRRAVAIGTPAVLRARTARELRLLGGEAAVPVAARDFSRAEHLVIRFPAYGPGDVEISLTATLLNRMGTAMRELTIVPAAAPGGENRIDLPLAGLASGEYMIELKASTPGGEARDRIGFRVTS
jgi:VWFA-related protein